ncbi:gliding motility-associated C-terminal domain-containing protein [Flavisolibacter sp. BT320]|nr:gliding motility-associated C-terminal domain-containing protein [Flavisolibacter longurius]
MQSGPYERWLPGVIFFLFLSFSGFAQVQPPAQRGKSIPSKPAQLAIANARVQQECDAVFMVHFKALQEKLSLYDTEGTTDGGTLSVGRLENDEGFVMKLTGKTDLEWARSYTINGADPVTFKRIIPSGDGNFLLLGIQNRLTTPTNPAASVLVKMTGTGTILWSQVFSLGGADLDIYSMVVADNGDILACGNSGWGTGKISSFVLRLSGTGNILWRKQVHHSATSGPVYKQLYLDGNTLYVLADESADRSYFHLQQWDAANGQLTWNKRLAVPGSNKLEAGLVTKIGDTVYALLSQYIPSDFEPAKIAPRSMVVKFNDKGDYLGSFRLDIPEHSDMGYDQALAEHLPSSYLQTTDDNFVVAARRLSGGHGVTLTKFTPGGQAIWSESYHEQRNYVVASTKNRGGGVLVAGRLLPGADSDNTGYLMQANEAGIISGMFGDIGPCMSAPTLRVLERFSGITEAGSDVQDVTIAAALTGVSCTLTDGAVSMEFSKACNKPATCTGADLAGPDLVCAADAVATFSVTPNAECFLPATFIIDTSFAVFENNDPLTRTATIRFKKWGVTTVSVQIVDGCSVVLVDKQVTVARPAQTLDLGNDSTVCAVTNFRLDAGEGFLSYRWQDGSKASFFIATSPGIFYVDVTDACGATKRDSVVLQQLPTVVLPRKNRLKCNQDSVYINAPAGYTSYEWTPAYNITVTPTLDVVVYPDVDTTYYLKAVTPAGCVAYDTIRVTVLQVPKIDLGADRAFCLGDAVQLNAGPGFVSYVWNNIAGGQQKTVRQAGTYTVLGTTAEGCRSADTMSVLNVWPLPVVTLDKATSFCEGSEKLLQAGSFASYRWQDGSSQASFSAAGPGTYHVTVTDNHGCKGSDTTRITTLYPLPKNFLPQDTELCAGASISIAPLQVYPSYNWSTGSSAQSLVITVPGTYGLQVQDQNGCIGFDAIEVRAKQCVAGIHIPTAFTPNRDGKNDVFRALVYEKLKRFELSVYNRWGEQVFHTKDPQKGWDGSRGGHRMETGAYVWLCRYTLETGEERVQKGTVTLVK